MLFNSVDFLIFFPIVFIIYYLLPERVRYLWLLISSYYFYMNWNPKYGALLLGCTSITYLGARWIEKSKNSRGKRAIFYLVLCLCANLGVLVFYKYSGFALGVLNRFFLILQLNSTVPTEWFDAIILPVGISFFILQSLGYLIDVYRGDVYAEKNFFRYALFISFFPQLVAGPIERSSNLLKQLATPKKISWINCKKGFFIMLYGYFLKLVIADRLAVFVDNVYGGSDTYPGLYIVIATALFAIQIYCDFYGYSTIARGVALFFGIKLVDNFNAPYLSMSIEEFWRRWHISLSSWFRDYLYIPIGGNRKGIVRKQANRMIVFGISGLWHGASFAYIIWGLLNGGYQVFADIFKKKINKVCENDIGTRLIKTFVTFVLVSFTWLFFRAGDVTNAIELLQAACEFNWDIFFNGAIFSAGITENYFRVLIFAIGILFYADLQKYRGKDITDSLMEQKWWFQGFIAIIGVVVILLYGCFGVEYNANQFIYFQF